MNIRGKNTEKTVSIVERERGSSFWYTIQG